MMVGLNARRLSSRDKVLDPFYTRVELLETCLPESLTHCPGVLSSVRRRFFYLLGLHFKFT